MAQQKFYRDDNGKYKLHSGANDSLQVKTLGVGQTAPTTGIAFNLGTLPTPSGEVGSITAALGTGTTDGSVLTINMTRPSAMSAGATVEAQTTTLTGHAADPADAELIGHTIAGATKAGSSVTYIGFACAKEVAAIDYCFASSGQNLTLNALNDDALTNGPDVIATAGDALAAGGGTGGAVQCLGGAANGGGAGGNVVCTGGPGGATGIGGRLLFHAGNAGGGGASGGLVELWAGNGATSGGGGNVSIRGGNGAGAVIGGALDFKAGAGGSTGAGGNATLSAGDAGGAGGGAGGILDLMPGTKAGAGVPGYVRVFARENARPLMVGGYTGQTAALLDFTDYNEVPYASVTATGNLLWGINKTNVTLSQTAQTVGAGTAFDITAQSSSAGAGGNLTLSAGSCTGGTGAGGSVNLVYGTKSGISSDGKINIKRTTTVLGWLYQLETAFGVEANTDTALTLLAGQASAGKGKTVLLKGGAGSTGQPGGDAVVEAGAPGSGGTLGSVLCKTNGTATLPKDSRIIHPLLNTPVADLTATWTEKGQYIIVNPADWPSSNRVVSFVAAAKAASANAADVIHVKLYDVSNGNDIIPSEVTISSTTWSQSSATVTLTAAATCYRIKAKLAGAGTSGDLGACELRILYN